MSPRTPHVPDPPAGRSATRPRRPRRGARPPADFRVVLRVELLDDLTLPNAVALTDALLLDQTTAGFQHHAAVGVRGDGGFVAVWEGPGPGGREIVSARLFTAAGAPAGNEFRVNSST